MEEATWLSLIMVVPKKTASLRFVWIFANWMLPQRRTHTFHQRGPQHGCRSWDVFFLGWLLRLPLDYESSKGSIQNNNHYRLGGFHLGCHAIQFEECPTHLPNSSKYGLQGILRHFHETISRQFQCFQWLTYPFAKVAPLFQQVLQIWYHLESWQMHVFGVF